MKFTRFLKNFGLGVLYAFLFPLLLLFAAIMGVFGIIMWLITAIRACVLFFQGKPAFPPFEEDVKVAKIKEAQLEMAANPGKYMGAQQVPGASQQTNTNNSSTTYIQQNYYQGPQHASAPEQPKEQQAPSQIQMNQTPIDATGYYSEDPRYGQIPQEAHLNELPSSPNLIDKPSDINESIFDGTEDE